jgi:hypothetical protein
VRDKAAVGLAWLPLIYKGCHRMCRSVVGAGERRGDGVNYDEEDPASGEQSSCCRTGSACDVLHLLIVEPSSGRQEGDGASPPAEVSAGWRSDWAE